MEYDKIDQALIDLYLSVKQSRMNKNGSRSIQSAIHERDKIRPSGKTGDGKVIKDKDIFKEVEVNSASFFVPINIETKKTKDYRLSYSLSSL